VPRNSRYRRFRDIEHHSTRSSPAPRHRTDRADRRADLADEVVIRGLRRHPGRNVPKLNNSLKGWASIPIRVTAA
jgi:hypothetical protein